ncbi:PREDICTED: oxysterol-binding protein-related protein 2A-like isoform X1 [Ipomoea nil]|uniref:oxysterol-binding protein-related protein 2A-like isoform X1 n=1 Tax=Ipomoea nil TaxID=35883 RepID=UPI000900F4A6|nr:PREDICTED: oxysterol-binding protein-related protein 2A-like isoform X1 [Ipomoea nil]XP_019171383.1 PREDICTED: oxysterol-binding protein-related protein 2A-like isoform X1 [Ipomoea nil]XP_019171384.1 PREDICTED: oxysterol-binding protein-related protein 2A-like isoform X1 [Ipomoea nil]XP_019171385.1 PREDICTED: oxysterol-binding protein-related protein 2A-like isoform X1 [Ipomoea nil]
MRVREMHPLCCVLLESGAIEEQSPEPTARLLRTGSAVIGSEVCGIIGSESATSVAGVLYKWTNYHTGWRSRWFTLRNGILSYSKTRRPGVVAADDGVKLIGHLPSNNPGQRKLRKTVRIVHLKVSSFRESRSDDRKFYIFTATKTLHLRTNSKKEKAAWIEALVSTRNLFMRGPVNDNISILPRDISISTEKLKSRLIDEGISEGLIKDCEKIMLSEFSEVQAQLKVLSEERSSLLDTLRQLEAANIEAESSGILDGEYQLLKHEYSNLGRGKFGEWSTTESSDDVEKQELEEASDEEETNFFDTNDYFSDPSISCGSIVADKIDKCLELENKTSSMKNICSENDNSLYTQVERRQKLPDPIEKEKAVSLWSVIKDNVGKDLTRVCLPVYFNEPVSSLQKGCEDLEHSYLLDRAYEHGKAGNSLLRILNVAAFAVSGYASTEGRHCKPFNPLLGETYEADYPEKGIRFFSEKVSHHPTLIACHCEGRGWKFWGDSNLKSKFWGRSIQLDPVGTLTLEFDDGEIFQWSKVTTSIYNLILGKIYCDHHGTMHIHGNRQYSCKLKFKEQSLLERNPHQVHGFVEDNAGKKVATLFGKWDESMYYLNGEWNSKPKEFSDASLLWKSSQPPPNLTRYNMSAFAITLNELTPGLQDKLPPTDSRLRPDQRYLENGEYDKANQEKQRLETRQRLSKKLQETGWKPRWFQREGEDGTFRYVGGYWEARENGKWDGCPNIFGQIDENLLGSFQGS